MYIKQILYFILIASVINFCGENPVDFFSSENLDTDTGTGEHLDTGTGEHLDTGTGEHLDTDTDSRKPCESPDSALTCVKNWRTQCNSVPEQNRSCPNEYDDCCVANDTGNDAGIDTDTDTDIPCETSESGLTCVADWRTQCQSEPIPNRSCPYIFDYCCVI